MKLKTPANFFKKKGKELKPPSQILGEQKRGIALKSPGEVLGKTVPDKPEIFSGGTISDVIDAISVPFYGFTGMATNLVEEIERGDLGTEDFAALPKDFVQGIKVRASWTDYLRENHPDLEERNLSIAGIDIPATVALGTVMDIVLDPAWLFPPLEVTHWLGRGGKTLLKAKPIREVVEGVSRTRVAQRFIGALDDFAERRAIMKRFEKFQDKMIQGVATDVEQGSQLARKAYNSLDETGQLLLSDYAEAGNKLGREMVLREAARQGISAKTIRELGEEAIALDTKMGSNLVDAGLMSRETFEKWRGKHLRRMYERFEWETVEDFVERLKKTDPERAAEIESQLKNLDVWGRKPRTPRLPTGALKKRKDLPKEIRNLLGEIEEFSPRIAKQTQLQARLVHRDRFFKEIAEEFASDTFQKGYLQLPKQAKTLGALRGKWVPEGVHPEIMRIIEQPKRWQQISKGIVGAWKMAKVIDNPATHFRNLMSNFFLADWGAGLSPARVDIYGEAFSDLINQGKWYQEAKEAGTFLIDTFAQREVGDLIEEMQIWKHGDWDGFIGTLKKLTSKVADLQKKAADVYQFEEQWGKMAIYIFKRKQGLAPEAAAEIAEKWLFNYRKVPTWMRKLRSGELGPITVPFMTFTAKAAQRIPEAFVKNPAGVLKYFKAARGLEKIDEQETEKEQRVLPDWMKEGRWVRLPVKDKHDRSLYFDARYIIPFGDVAEFGGIIPGNSTRPSSETKLEKGLDAVLGHFPFVQFMEDLRRNESAFTGRPIYEKGATPTQVRQQIGQYIANFALPPLLGGYAFQDLKEAVMETPDWKGRKRSLKRTIAASVFGLKTRPIDYTEELNWRMREIRTQINNVKRNLDKIADDPALSGEEKEQIWEEGMNQIDRLLKEYTHLFVNTGQ